MGCRHRVMMCELGAGIMHVEGRRAEPPHSRCVAENRDRER